MTVNDAAPAQATDITVNLDGLWLLQALLGITRLAPELRARPYGEPRSPSQQHWATQHPELHILVDQGMCDAEGVVRADIAARMAVLAAPDVEVIVLVSAGPMNWAPQVSLSDPSTWRAIPDEQLRIVLARRQGRWASAVRAGGHITIDDCPGGDEERLGRLVFEALDASHPIGPARISPLNVPLDDMCAAVAQRSTHGTTNREAALRALGLRGAALAELRAALDEPVAEAVLYARAYVDAATAMSESVLNLRDTASGRVAMYRLAPPRGSHQQWMAIGPATAPQVRHGITTVLGSVPVRSWNTHDRMA
ncbi:MULTISPECIES: ESX secretion-associated protein EspG [Mycobacterium]|uniref:ESX secretion-associated protein EspG n=1 Tax=Mycobacterium TaxID=1763 RepID=UPI0005EF37ED|nr:MULTISPECIES: ESX secretion-associated protein EspG [Mycobacterium]MCV7034866.1 ESX secretion-associated protein EspG [Mycobacterium heckeshornense]